VVERVYRHRCLAAGKILRFKLMWWAQWWNVCIDTDASQQGGIGQGVIGQGVIGQEVIGQGVFGKYHKLFLCSLA
jgi:hypothetical protein